MSEHTPGPCKAMRQGNVPDGDWIVVAEAQEMMLCRALDWCFATTGRNEWTRMTLPAEANATLWAAAPDLLAACEAEYKRERAAAYDNAFRDNYCGKPGEEKVAEWLSPLGKQLRAAIAKARGE